MAAGASSTADLSVINAIAERDHIVRGALGNRTAAARRGLARIGIRSFRRIRGSSHDFTRRARGAGAWRNLAAAVRRSTDINDLVNPPSHVVGNVQRTIGSDGDPAGPMRGFVRRFIGARETVRKHLARPRRVIAGERLVDDVVSGLRIRRAIPRAVKRDEHAAAVARGKLCLVVVRHSIRRPVRGERNDGRNLLRADADFFAAVTAVLRRQDQFFLEGIVVAFRPTIVAALLQKHHLFGGQRGLLVRLVKLRPVRMELIAAVLRHEQPAACVEGHALAVANSSCVSLGGGKCLIRFVRVIEPDSAAGLKFRARVLAGRGRCAILHLTGIARRGDIDVHHAV